MSTYVLFGKTNRDPDELVCEFFASREDADEFTQILDGTYDMLVVEGIDFNDVHITHVIHPHSGTPWPGPDDDEGEAP